MSRIANYWFEDIITDPKDPKLYDVTEGTSVFASNNVDDLLDMASCDTNICTFKKAENSREPFVVTNEVGHEFRAGSIILRKIKYVPFSNPHEFIIQYNEVIESKYKDEDDLNSLYNYGMWIRVKGDYPIVHVAEIWNDGLVLGDGKDGITWWNEIFNSYKFLDGTPCGLEVTLVP